jgi:hypothetical protein
MIYHTFIFLLFDSIMIINYQIKLFYFYLSLFILNLAHKSCLNDYFYYIIFKEISLQNLNYNLPFFKSQFYFP